MFSRCTFGLAVAWLLMEQSAFAVTPEKVAALLNQPVELLLEDGRMPRGVLSPKSNGQWLVLQTDVPDITIESRFSSGMVKGVEPITGPRSNPEPIQNLPIPPAPGVESSLPSEAFRPPWEDQPGLHVMPMCLPEPCGPLGALPLFPAMDRLLVPRSLHISTTVANWDADNLTDGILLRVQPLDGWGRIVPVEGHLDVQLVTETRFATGGRSITRNDSFRVTERWSVPIHAIDFDDDGTVVKLPFRRIRPERDVDLAPDALVVARLRVPSAGSLDASDPFVVLRPSSRFRDDAFLLRNNRRVPAEGPLR